MSRILILIVLASLAFTATGCGSKPATSGVAQLTTTTTTNTATQGNGSSTNGSKQDSAVKYSACMRSHGVPKFPDPVPASGGGMSLTIDPRHGVDPRSPQFQAAQKACEKLVPMGKASANPAMQAKAQAQMLKFSACMRSHGLPNFPDPKFSGGGAQLSMDKSNGLNPNSPVFKAAEKACQKVMPGPPDGAKHSVSGPSIGTAVGQ